MARMTRTVIDYTDDMTGLHIDERDVDKLFFSIDGANFKMDTHSDLANEIRELLARAAANAEQIYYQPQAPAPTPRKRTNPERSRLLKIIRNWAKTNNLPCTDTGRIPHDIVTAFRKANPGVDMKPYDQS
ncbi:histone-like nucleoid-structuring protein Lsr2 [Streptomyces sp. NPDC059982]|uniref:Lsr2 family DNA-binding protein n=1 Tax=unclassified Streptomyces TaxID=2593676 RepID=UPI00367702CB